MMRPCGPSQDTENIAAATSGRFILDHCGFGCSHGMMSCHPYASGGLTYWWRESEKLWTQAAGGQEEITVASGRGAHGPAEAAGDSSTYGDACAAWWQPPSNQPGLETPCQRTPTPPDRTRIRS